MFEGINEWGGDRVEVERERQSASMHEWGGDNVEVDQVGFGICIS